MYTRLYDDCSFPDRHFTFGLIGLFTGIFMCVILILGLEFILIGGY